LGATVAADRLLDGSGRILVDAEPGLGPDQHDRASRLPEQQRRANVDACEGRLQGQLAWLKLDYHLAQIAGQ